MFGYDQGPARSFTRVFITDRRQCTRPLPEQVAHLAGEIDAVILREKDLDEGAYERLAAQVAAVCEQYDLAFVGHTQVCAVRHLGCCAVHLPLPQLRKQGRPAGFMSVGTNVHALDEVQEAEALGADVLIASPIFRPSCKPNAVPQGELFLRSVIECAHVPVFALGGITDATEELVRAWGAAGACRMADYAQR